MGCFHTGPQAHIQRIHVYDGEKEIATIDNLNLQGGPQAKNFTVTNNVSVTWGSGISIFVTFDAQGSAATGAWVNIISVGIDYQ